jgi:hypothetical protein
MRSLFHNASSFSLRTKAATALRSAGDRSAFSLLPNVLHREFPYTLEAIAVCAKAT